MNEIIRVLICSKVSENRISMNLSLDRKTVARKKRFLAFVARIRNEEMLELCRAQVAKLYLDELITLEHTRCKPLAVACVVTPERRVLGITTSVMPAIGKHLAEISRKRYGPRPNERPEGVLRLLAEISRAVAPNPTFITDEEPSYGECIRRVFPDAHHVQHPSKRAAVAGQGELKTKEYDPLFPINHTFAMFRDNVASLVRRTWCTAKKLSAVDDHLQIYIDFHNSALI